MTQAMTPSATQATTDAATERNAVHAMFRIERRYKAPPIKIFQAFADREVKRRWFAGPAEWERVEEAFDFRVGGREAVKSIPKGGPVHSFDARYMDIVPDQRIVYAYDMHIGDSRISCSLATIEIEPDGTGTRLVVTEQGAFLDGYDNGGSREHGTGILFDQLGRATEG